MKSKKIVALRAAALVGAVSGAALITLASSPVKAAEESCWQQTKGADGKEHHLRGCAYDQYGLKPGLRPADGGTNRNSNQNGDFDNGGGAGGPTTDPVDPYTGG